MCALTSEELDSSEYPPTQWLQRLPAAIEADDSVLIRPFQLEDALPMYQAARESLDQLCAWMTWCRSDFSLTDAEVFVSQCGRAWARGEHYSFAIIDAQTGNFLGSVGLNQLNHTHKVANVGYWVRNSAAGRGVATAAVRPVASFGLRKLGLNRLEFLIPTINVASQRVAQKLGAKFEGMMRSRLVIAGQSHDAAMYALVKADA